MTDEEIQELIEKLVAEEKALLGAMREITARSPILP